MLSLKSIYRRITVNKFTLCFFLFSFVHCFTQGILQALLYSVDYASGDLVSTIVSKAEVPRGDLAWLTGWTDDFQIQLCTNVPLNVTANKTKPFCATLFRSSDPGATIPVPASYKRSTNQFSLSHRSTPDRMTLETSRNSTGQIDGINLSTNRGASTVFLSNQCTRLLVYPNQAIKDFIREDAALIALQFWLFSISFFAIIYESIPHLISVLVARVLVTNFSAFSTWRTGHVAQYVEKLITDPGSPCGVDLFTTYFHAKTSFEIPNLVLNSVGLLMSAFFIWRLAKIYNVHTFKTVGPPPEVLRIYRFYMAFFVCLQLSVYCLVTAMALWTNELINGPIKFISAHTPLYISVFVESTVLLIPWLTIGWFAVRRESKQLMMWFLFLGSFFILAWSIMFYSLVFRWTFIQWPFFASLTAEAFIVLIASCILGIICWRNFNKGLAHFLYVEEVLAKDGFEPETFTHDVEKLDFKNDARYILTTEDLKESHM